MSTGKSTGYCVECGDGVTQFVPIYEGSKIEKGVSCLELARQDEKEANKLEKIYKLLDKKEIKLGAERFEYTEQLFNPNKYGKDMNGIAVQANDSLMQIEPNLRTELYGNIMLAGGSTMMPGFVERFNTDLTKIAPESRKINVTAPPNGDIAANMGGKIFASLSTFKSAFVTREVYDECGPDIINRVCP
ncbi:actin, putative [Entamoeba invadens IP1]|uniref:Actin, putative n=1 Tax=Entamoeba invadens IP1 TaxID=370355 RepID=L7FPB3_ENTIV|nr:actin, putative [Entamoeba invadens IP1]ELP90242.1 actin, putative [Entamoeba invadens IP1]|eukprot:XP_004257013.1 actin, putative [Entamoeba invadens IP1]